ncbi:hypothetical protein [Parapedobacter sp.]
MVANLCRFIHRYLGTIWLVAFVVSVNAQQSDKWSGIWEMQYQPWPHIPPIHMELQLARPVADMLYPARLSLTYGDFTGVYKFLLVKKNEHQLGVGRNKVPVNEQPFALGPWMMYLNGTLDYRPTGTGAQLSLSRHWIDRMGIFMSGLYDNEVYTNTKTYIRNFLYREDILLRQTDTAPQQFPLQDQLIYSDSIFYGIYDPIPTDTSALEFSVHDEEHYDQDTVTIVQNGRVLIDGLPIEQAVKLDQLTLDTGENYIAFFAENYGTLPPNTANFIIGTTGNDAQLFSFDFSHRANAYATVIVARFQYKPPTGPPETQTRPKPTTAHGSVHASGRRDVQIGKWRIATQKIELEIWDDQVEDGDVISIEVNDALVVGQEAVTKKTKRFGITLKPGNNHIVFSARNLGKIPPNTAALSIIADGQKKTFRLNTDFERNNVLDIIVEN